MCVVEDAVFLMSLVLFGMIFAVFLHKTVSNENIKLMSMKPVLLACFDDEMTATRLQQDFWLVLIIVVHVSHYMLMRKITLQQKEFLSNSAKQETKKILGAPNVVLKM